MNFKNSKAHKSVIGFFGSGSSRTRMAKRHVSLSLVYKSLDIGLNLIMIRLVLDYLDVERYGVWLLLFSITTWLRFLNVGFDHGLRNRLAEALAKNETDKARKYISTTYALMLLISVAFCLVYLLINPFVDWTRILNTTAVPVGELSLLVMITFFSFAATFTLKIITTVLIANQHASINDLTMVLATLLKFVSVLVLMGSTDGSLLLLGIFFSVAPVVVFSFFNAYYFIGRYRDCSPSLKYVHFSILPDLLGLGAKFFVISVANVVIFSTGSIIVAQLYGSEAVAPYQISERYFRLSFVFFQIILQPMWSAVTDAYHRNDIDWIERSVKKLKIMWVCLTLVILAMVFSSPVIFRFWLGDKVEIPLMLSFSWGAYMIILTYNRMYSFVLNGLGKVGLQVYFALFGMF
jgi:O-antigen/teichoic acid export membrane protein